jgi:hypothetical protein
MIWREGFVYERFTLTEPIVEGGLERIGDLIIGLPQGQFPQFELCDKGKDWQQILGQVLTREEEKSLVVSLAVRSAKESVFGREWS